MKNLWFNLPGLGPNILGPLRYLLPYHNLFHEAAVNHDVEGYSKDGIETDRMIADLTFYAEMLKVCKTVNEIKWASIYFNLVRKYGYLFFNYSIPEFEGYTDI